MLGTSSMPMPAIPSTTLGTSETQAPPLPSRRGSFAGGGCAPVNHSTVDDGRCYTSSMPPVPGRQAKAVTVINLKGGVGKTHTAWLLAGVCQERDRKSVV